MPVLAFRTSEAVGELFKDFAEYSGLSRSGLVVMLADEQRELSVGKEGLEYLNCHVLTNRRLAHLRNVGNSTQLNGDVSQETMSIYRSEAARLGLPVAKLARVNVLYGLMLEIDQERYAITPPTTQQLEF